MSQKTVKRLLPKIISNLKLLIVHISIWTTIWRVKDHNDRDIKSHITRASENYHQPVSEKDFKIIGNGFQGNKKKRKVDDALLIREIKQTLNEHPRSVGATAVI